MSMVLVSEVETPFSFTRQNLIWHVFLATMYQTASDI